MYYLCISLCITRVLLVYYVVRFTRFSLDAHTEQSLKIRCFLELSVLSCFLIRFCCITSFGIMQTEILVLNIFQRCHNATPLSIHGIRKSTPEGAFSLYCSRFIKYYIFFSCWFFALIAILSKTPLQ